MPNKNLIVIAANTSWGLHNFRRNLILSLVEEGYDLVAISMRDDYSEKLKALGCQCVNIDIDSGGKNPFKDLKIIIQLFRLFREISPFVVLYPLSYIKELD